MNQNKYDLTGDYGVGFTSNTNREFYFDLEDYEVIKKYYWYEHHNGNGYGIVAAQNPDTHKKIKMHQLLGFDGYDHTNRNPMDNRKVNLREATRQENNQNHSIASNNTSGIIGVSFDKNRNKWSAGIAVDGKWMWLGRYSSKRDAIIARLNAEQKYYKNFAPQRHLFDEYCIDVTTGGCV